MICLVPGTTLRSQSRILQRCIATNQPCQDCNLVSLLFLSCLFFFPPCHSIVTWRIAAPGTAGAGEGMLGLQPHFPSSVISFGGNRCLYDTYFKPAASIHSQLLHLNCYCIHSGIYYSRLSLVNGPRLAGFKRDRCWFEDFIAMFNYVLNDSSCKYALYHVEYESKNAG